MIIFVFGIDYLIDVIKYVDISFLRKRVKIKSKNVDNDRLIIFVGDEYMNDFGKWFFVEFFGNCFLYVVLNFCLMNENIVIILIKEFIDYLEKVEMLLKEMELLNDEEKID